MEVKYNKSGGYVLYDSSETKERIQPLAVSYYQKALISGETKWLPCYLNTAGDFISKNTYQRSSCELIRRIKRADIFIALIGEGAAYIAEECPV